MSPKELRHAVAADIAAGLGAGWTTYPAPPEVVTAPAVVVAPGSPYRQDSTYCDEEVRLTATIVIQRAGSSDALDLMDDTITTVRAAVHGGATGARVNSVSGLGQTIEVGGVESLSAEMTMTAQSS